MDYGEGVLLLNQSRLPFDIYLESLTPFNISRIGYVYSQAGMRIHLRRNNFALLIGGYYGPTIIFSTLSLVSYSIRTEVVCI